MRPPPPFSQMHRVCYSSMTFNMVQFHYSESPILSLKFWFHLISRQTSTCENRLNSRAGVKILSHFAIIVLPLIIRSLHLYPFLQVNKCIYLRAFISLNIVMYIWHFSTHYLYMYALSRHIDNFYVSHNVKTLRFHVGNITCSYN